MTVSTEVMTSEARDYLSHLSSRKFRDKETLGVMLYLFSRHGFTVTPIEISKQAIATRQRLSIHQTWKILSELDKSKLITYNKGTAVTPSTIIIHRPVDYIHRI